MSKIRTSPYIPRCEAEDELRERGFVINADGTWNSTIDLGAFGEIPTRTVLPLEFPRVLPEIFIDRSKLPKRVPHIEKSGKICMAPSTGVLLDITAPRQLIRDSLKRAQDVLVRGLSGSNTEEFLEEFSAYWNSDVRGAVGSICEASAESRIIQSLGLVRPGQRQHSMTLVADDFSAAKEWAERVGWRIGNRDEAFFLRIETAFEPPDFDESVSTNQILELILLSASPEANSLMKTWLWRKNLPASIVISIPLPHNQGSVLIGARLEAAVGRAKHQSQKGFRPGHVPAALEMRFTQQTPIGRLLVRRFDADYLLYRGGGSGTLYPRIVAVVGCGAIGSHVAENLASIGVGSIRIIDPEDLMPENVHRHALGASFVDTNKAAGMQAMLNQHFPHIKIEHRAERVEAVLEAEPNFITDADLVIIALGDETLELYLNDLLRDQMPRLHVWVEPLSIGGHLLATGLTPGRGCFRCLFETDLILGIHNESAFAAIGQMFQPSYSGCAGTFTPFTGVDADRAAIEAATFASRILLKEERQNFLVSWRGYDDHFIRAGFRLSERAKMFEIGERRIETRFVNNSCISCGQSVE